MLKRSFVWVLTAVLLCTLLPGFAAAAPNDIAFEMRDVSGIKPGQEFSVVISMTGGPAEVCGFDFTVRYNPNLLSYVEDSLRSDVFSGATVFHKNGSISCVWESTENVSVQSGRIFTLNFKALETFSATTLTLAFGDVYKCTSAVPLDFAALYSANDTAAAAAVTPAAAGTDEAVSALVAKIGALGPAEATQAYREKLDGALADYSALTAAQKKQVTNYGELVEKYNSYTALGENRTDGAVTQFRQEHAEALALRTSTVTVANEAAVTAALTAWEALPVSAQLELVRERMLLKALDGEIYDLNAENREQQEQEKLYQEALEAVAEFKKNNAWQLELTVDTVLSGHRPGLAVTKSDLDTIEAIHDLAFKLLTEDGTAKLVNDLYNKANELYAAENPEDLEYILEADSFRSKFSYILSLKPEELTYEDASDVNAAYLVFGFLRAKTRSYLEEEGKILEALMAAAETLSPEPVPGEPVIIPGETVVIPGETVIVPGDTVTKVETNTVYKDNSLKEAYNLVMGAHSKGKIISVMLILVPAMILLAAAARGLFWYLKKKDKEDIPAEETKGGAL